MARRRSEISQESAMIDADVTPGMKTNHHGDRSMWRGSFRIVESLPSQRSRHRGLESDRNVIQYQTLIFYTRGEIFRNSKTNSSTTDGPTHLIETKRPYDAGFLREIRIICNENICQKRRKGRWIRLGDFFTSI